VWKFILGAAGAAIAVFALTTASAQHAPDGHKYLAAAVIVVPCLIIGAVADRRRRPKPETPLPRASSAFGAPPRRR